MAQVQDRSAPAPLSPGDRRLLAGAAAALTTFAGVVAYTIATSSQRPALAAGTVLATLLVSLLALRWRRDPSGGDALHPDDPRGFKSRRERAFWDESA